MWVEEEGEECVRELQLFPLQEEALLSIGKGCTGLLFLNLSYCYVTDSIIRILTKSGNYH